MKGVIIAIVIIGSLIISWLDGGGFGEAGSFSKYLFDRSHEMLATAPLSDQLPKYSQPTVPRHLASLQLGFSRQVRSGQTYFWSQRTLHRWGGGDLEGEESWCQSRQNELPGVSPEQISRVNRALLSLLLEPIVRSRGGQLEAEFPTGQHHWTLPAQSLTQVVKQERTNTQIQMHKYSIPFQHSF